MKKVMKASKKYVITLACFAVILVACIGATIGITMAYFGDVKSATANIQLGAAIEFDGTQGIAVAATNVTDAAVPSQVVTVQTTLKIVKGAQGKVTKGVLQVVPEFDAGDTGVSLTFTDGESYAVTGVSGAEMVVKGNKLYLVTTDTENLAEIDPSSDVTISFTVPVTIPSNIGNTKGGEAFNLKMTAKVLQSTIYTTSGGNTVQVDKTIDGFANYFEGFTAAA